MKTLAKLALSLPDCKLELAAFKQLLDERPTLSERDDILPFFQRHRHLAALVGSYNPRINRFDRIATEFNLFGDHACDLVIGDSVTQHYCFVEFENAAPTSVFTKKKGKSTPEWSSRFDHGFSQIIDWFALLEDQQRTALHRSRFGAESIQYMGLLVIGRRHYLDDSQFERLRWRSEHVLVCSKHVNCITFDELYQTLALKLAIFGGSSHVGRLT